MPSLVHQALVLLMQQSPRLWTWLLRNVLGLDLAGEVSFDPGPETIHRLETPDHHADGVVVTTGGNEGAREAFISEVQLGRDSDKFYAWALYVVGTAQRLRCPATLVVITNSTDVERWSAGTIDLGRGRLTLRPLVIGPSNVPHSIDRQLAHEIPELAILMVAMHGRGPGSQRLTGAALDAVAMLARHDERRAWFYVRLIAIFTGEESAQMMSEQMKQDFLRRLDHAVLDKWGPFLFQDALERQQRTARKGALGLVLSGRGLAPTAEQQAMIDACRDDEVMDRWLRRAACAETVDALFEEV